MAATKLKASDVNGGDYVDLGATEVRLSREVFIHVPSVPNDAICEVDHLGYNNIGITVRGIIDTTVTTDDEGLNLITRQLLDDFSKSPNVMVFYDELLAPDEMNVRMKNYTIIRTFTSESEEGVEGYFMEYSIELVETSESP